MLNKKMTDKEKVNRLVERIKNCISENDIIIGIDNKVATFVIINHIKLKDKLFDYFEVTSYSSLLRIFHKCGFKKRKGTQTWYNNDIKINLGDKKRKRELSFDSLKKRKCEVDEIVPFYNEMMYDKEILPFSKMDKSVSYEILKEFVEKNSEGKKILNPNEISELKDDISLLKTTINKLIKNIDILSRVVFNNVKR